MDCCQVLLQLCHCQVVLHIGISHRHAHTNRRMGPDYPHQWCNQCPSTPAHEQQKNEQRRLSAQMPLDLCMFCVSDGGVLTAWNNCKMSKSCYSSHPMHITIDISCWCIIYEMQNWSSSSNRYELYYSGMRII